MFLKKSPLIIRKIDAVFILCYNESMARISKNNSDFYQERNLKNLDKIDEILEQLPPFCEDFFRGIETRTSTLTRLNYVYDLRIFFDFLSRKKLREKPLREITLEELEQVRAEKAAKRGGFDKKILLKEVQG